MMTKGQESASLSMNEKMAMNGQQLNQVFLASELLYKISEAIHCAKTTQRVLTPIAELCKNSMVSQKDSLIKPYHCHHCMKSFKSSNGLKYHMEKEHRRDGDRETIGDCYIRAAQRHGRHRLYRKYFTENIPFSAPSPDKHIKSLPPALTIKQQADFTSSPGLNWLAEFAAIATSPQSPLMQKTILDHKQESTMYQTDYNNNTTQQFLSRHSPPPQLVDPNPFRSISEPARAVSKEDSDARVTSSSPYPSTMSCGSDNWSHLWPKEAWLCFIRGTRVRLITMDEWRCAEDVGHDASLCASAARHSDSSDLSTYAPHGVRLVDYREIKDTVLATFDSTISGQPRLYAEFASDHPFFVKNKGWASVRPGLSATHYGIPCQRFLPGDICLPHSHPEAVSISPGSASPKTENTNTFDFTAMDSNAVVTLSNMAKQRREHDDLRSKILSSSNSQNLNQQPPAKKARTEPERAKRPMNAFMLFAKRFRLEITQMYPGKDNRAISVILGDKWKSMKPEERKAYVIEAKILADEHKRLHPDCWKRKRTTQGSSKVASCRRL